MTYGLKIKNNSNELLVDSDFEHYHFAGKGQYSSSFQTPALTGGNVTQHSYSGSTTLSSSQVPGRVWVFTLSGRASSGSPAPLIFIKDANQIFFGHIMTKRVGTNWEFWILSSDTGTGGVPVTYCFLPLDEMSLANATASSGENYGLATFNGSGKRTYDSRFKPLKIVGNVTTSAATSSARSSIAANYNPDFTPNRFTNTVFSYPNVQTELMYCCPSIATVCQEVQVSNSGSGFQAQGCNSFFYAWARQDLWWGFYRNTYRVTTVNGQRTLISRYTPYAYGHVWKSVEDSSSVLGVVAAAALGFATFGASLVTLGAVLTAGVLASSFSGVSASGGLYYPYVNSSRNNSQLNPMMLAKWSDYD
jgi:hypothetical protein|tara:strand:+ start:99 stop:1184 length:1086 start_codon:yes stop_codon:yes gene_type:complete